MEANTDHSRTTSAITQVAQKIGKNGGKVDSRLLQQQLGLFFENTPDSVCVKDENLVHLYGNPVLLEKIGCPSLDEFIGTTVHDWVEKEAAEAVDRLEYDQLASKEPVSGLIAYTLRNGKKGYQQSRKFVFFDEDGRKFIAAIDTELGELFNEKKRAEDALQGIVRVLEKTVELKDPYTAGHESRVTAIAISIAAELGMSEAQTECIRLAASVHDVGKIAVPTDILNKPGRLTPAEFSIIQEHPETAYQTLHDVEFDYPIAEVARQHHEKLDGSGYPLGISGDEIREESRILTVSDVLEAMTSHRPYRPGLPLEKAVEELTNGKRTKYDEHVVDACLSLLAKGKLSLSSW